MTDTVRARVQPGRTHYRPRGTHPYRAGDEFELPRGEFEQLKKDGHVAEVLPDPPAAPAEPAPQPAAPAPEHAAEPAEHQ